MIIIIIKANPRVGIDISTTVYYFATTKGSVHSWHIRVVQDNDCD